MSPNEFKVCIEKIIMEGIMISRPGGYETPAVPTPRGVKDLPPVEEDEEESDEWEEQEPDLDDLERPVLGWRGYAAVAGGIRRPNGEVVGRPGAEEGGRS